MISRTTDDYEAMAQAGIVAVIEPAFWLGQPRTNVGSYQDYLSTITGFERFRAGQFGIRHYCTIGLNPKEANNEALAEAVYPRYRALVLLAAWTGARWGELIALTRDRVDLVAGQMRIDRQYVLLKAEGDHPARVVLQSPKTEAGRRTVHIPPHLLPVLAAHLLEHVPPGCELVFPNDHGEPLHRGSFTTVWHRARERAGLPGFHFHDLRHTGNTLAAATGASLADLMARMGHASVDAALRYQHATRTQDTAIAGALSDLIVRSRSA